MLVIAEVKTSSPFGWHSDRSWDELFAIANDTGDIISIHTDIRWGGSFDLLKKARGLTKKPILAKGIHSTDEEIVSALEIGANFVLVVGRLPKDHLDRCMIEPNSIEQLKSLPKNVKAIWNSRDLKTGGIKKESFESARQEFTGWLCQASNIKNIENINPQADAVLIGTNLPKLAGGLKNFPRSLSS